MADRWSKTSAASRRSTPPGVPAPVDVYGKKRGGFGFGTLLSEIGSAGAGLASLVLPGSKSGEPGWADLAKGTVSSLAGTAITGAKPLLELADLLGAGDIESSLERGVGRLLGDEEKFKAYDFIEAYQDRGLLPALVETVGNVALVGAAITAPVRGAAVGARLAGATGAEATLRGIHSGLIARPLIKAVQHPYITAGKAVRENLLKPAFEADLTAFKAANAPARAALPVVERGSRGPGNLIKRTFDATEDGKVIGTADVLVDPDTRVATLDAINTPDPKHRGKGAATSILDKVYETLGDEGEGFDIQYTPLSPDGERLVSSYMAKRPDRVDPSRLVTEDTGAGVQPFKPKAPMADRIPGASGPRIVGLLAEAEKRLQAREGAKAVKETGRVAEMERRIVLRSPAVRAAIKAAEYYADEQARATGSLIPRAETSLAIGDEIRARATGVKALEDDALERGIPQDALVKAGIRQKFLPESLAGDEGFQGMLAEATDAYITEHAAATERLTAGRKGTKGLEDLDATEAEPTRRQKQLIQGAQALIAKAEGAGQALKIARERVKLERYVGWLLDKIGKAGNDAARADFDASTATEAFDHARKWVPKAWKGKGALAKSAKEIHEAALGNVAQHIADGEGEFGGATFNPHTNRFLVGGEDIGIIVGAVPGTAIEVPWAEFQANGAALIEQAVKAYEGVYQFPRTTIGVWLDEGIVYIDPGQIVDDLGESLVLGAARSQLSLFDLGANDVVNGMLQGRPDLAIPFLKRRSGLSKTAKRLAAIDPAAVPKVLDAHLKLAYRLVTDGKITHPDAFFVALNKYTAKNVDTPASALAPRGLASEITEALRSESVTMTPEITKVIQDTADMIRSEYYKAVGPPGAPDLVGKFEGWLDPERLPEPAGAGTLNKVPETGTMKQRAVHAPKFPEPPAKGKDLYASGREVQKALNAVETAAKRKKTVSAAAAHAEKDLEAVRRVLAEGRLPSELERDAMKARGTRILEKVQKQLGNPSEPQAPARLQPLWRAVKSLERLAQTDPGIAEILSDLPQNLDDALRLATEAGFDPTHVSEFSNTKVRRLVFGSMRLGKGGTTEVEAGVRKGRTGTLARAGGVDRSIEALQAGILEVVNEKRIDGVVTWVESVGQKIAHGTPIPPGFGAWDPARHFLLTGTRLSEDGAKALATASGEMTIVPTAVLNTIDKYTKDFNHPAFKAIAKVTDPWRTLILTLSPGWYVRGFVGNAILATAEGASLRDFVAAWRSLRTRDEFGAFADIPFIGGTGDAVEAGSRIDPSLIPRRGIRRAIDEGGKVRGTASYASRGMLRVQGVIDEFARAAVYHQGRRLNMAPEHAFAKAQNALVDYNNLSPFERSVVRSVIPFYAWQKGILKITMNQVLEHPARTGLLMTMGRLQDEYIADRFGLEKEDVPALYKHLVGKVNVRSFNPFSDPADLVSPEGIARSLNPFIELIARKGLGAPEFYSGKQRLSFFGTPEDDVDVGSELTEMITRSPGGRVLDQGPGTNLLGVSTVDDAVLRSRFLKARRQIRGIPNPETPVAQPAGARSRGRGDRWGKG